MKNVVELQELGQILSKSFLQSGEDMTATLTKMAEDKGLSPEEMSRVAEIANVEAYLGMIKKAEDKYIEFPLAKAKDAYKELEKSAKISKIVNDEEDVDYEDLSTNFSLSDYGVELHKEELNKTAELFKQSQRYNATIAFGTDRVLEAKVDFDKHAQEVTDNIEQLILSERYSPEDIKGLIKQASPNIGDSLVEYLLGPLSKKMPLKDFTKEASARKVSENSSLYKSIQELDEKFGSLVKLSAATLLLEKDYNEFIDDTKVNVKTASAAGAIKKLKGFFGFFKKHPALSTAGGALIVSPAVYAAGKKEGKQFNENYLTKKTVSDMILANKNLLAKG